MRSRYSLIRARSQRSTAAVRSTATSAPKVNATRPAGEWNSIDIECRGPKIHIVLNGQVIQDIDQSTIDEIKDKPLSGYFCLQSHTKQIEFRKVQLKELPEK